MSNEIKIGDNVERFANTVCSIDDMLSIKIGDKLTVTSIEDGMLKGDGPRWGKIDDFKKVEPTTIEQLSADMEELQQKAEELGEQIKKLQEPVFEYPLYFKNNTGSIVAFTGLNEGTCIVGDQYDSAGSGSVAYYPHTDRSVWQPCEKPDEWCADDFRNVGCSGSEIVLAEFNERIFSIFKVFLSSKGCSVLSILDSDNYSLLESLSAKEMAVYLNENGYKKVANS